MSTVVIMIKQAEKPNIWVSRPCSLTGLWPVNVLFAQTGGIGIKATFGLFEYISPYSCLVGFTVTHQAGLTND